MNPQRVLAAVAVLVICASITGCGAASSSTSAPEPEASEEPAATASAAAPSASAASEEPPADATRLEDGATVVMSQFAFAEAAVIVPVGATLTFVNEDNVAHTVTHGVQGFPVDDPAFDEPVAAGDSVEITFDEAGRYDITCVPHPIMQMAVFAEG
jgi:plastocyanin